MATGPVKFTQIREQIFKVSCNFSSCHSSAAHKGNLDLEASPYSSLINVDPLLAGAKAKGWKLVVPSDETRSFIYQKVTLAVAKDNALGSRMPEGGVLEPDRVALLKNWIQRGAPND